MALFLFTAKDKLSGKKRERNGGLKILQDKVKKCRNNDEFFVK